MIRNVDIKMDNNHKLKNRRRRNNNVNIINNNI